MGLAVTDNALYLANLYQLWRSNNVLPPGERTPEGADRLYVPQMSWVTGDVDVHDMAVDAQGRVVFINTLFSCLATVDGHSSFVPLW